MVVLLKVIISLGLAMGWFYLTENQEVSIAFFVLMLIIFFIRPISYQSPTEREEYIDKIRKAKERQMMLEQERRREARKAVEEKLKRKKKNPEGENE